MEYSGHCRRPFHCHFFLISLILILEVTFSVLLESFRLLSFSRGDDSSRPRCLRPAVTANDLLGRDILRHSLYRYALHRAFCTRY